MTYSVCIQDGMDVEIFCTFDTPEEAFDCYSDLRQHHHFSPDAFAFVESGWISADQLITPSQS